LLVTLQAAALVVQLLAVTASLTRDDLGDVAVDNRQYNPRKKKRKKTYRLMSPLSPVSLVVVNQLVIISPLPSRRHRRCQ
jgi:hypothetical protein